MQVLLLEELNKQQVANLRNWLAGQCQQAGLPDTFWLMLPEDLLNQEQNAHRANCGPFCLAVVLDEFNACLRLELLVRPRMSLHCSCFAMADQQQRAFALAFWDQAFAASKETQTHGH